MSRRRIGKSIRLAFRDYPALRAYSIGDVFSKVEGHRGRSWMIVATGNKFATCMDIGRPPRKDAGGLIGYFKQLKDVNLDEAHHAAQQILKSGEHYEIMATLRLSEGTGYAVGWTKTTMPEKDEVRWVFDVAAASFRRGVWTVP